MPSSQTKRQTSFLFTTGLLIVSSLVSLLLGVVRDRIYSTYFTAAQLDPFFAAFKVPDTIFQLIVLGAISASFVPVLVTVKKENGEESFNRLIQAVFTAGFIALSALCVVIFITAPWFVRIIFNGFTEENIQKTIILSRIVLVSPLFMGISSIGASVLYTHKKFFVASLSPIAYNVGIIATVLIFKNKLDIYGLGIGVAIGALLYLAVIIPMVIRYKFFHNYRPTLRHHGLKKIIKMSLPRFLTIAIVQMGLLYDSHLASGLAYAGSLAIYNQALKIQNMPVNNLAIHTSNVAFPTLVEFAAEKNWKEYNKMIIDALRQALFLTLPISIFLALMIVQIVKIFVGPKFTDQDIALIGSCTILFAISIWAQSLLYVMVKGFYALQNTMTPLIIAVIAFAIKITSAYYFKNAWETVPALPLSFSLGQIVNAILLIGILHSITKFLSLTALIEFLKITFASAVMGAFIYFTFPLWFQLLQPHSMILNLIYISVVAGTSFGLYFLISYILKVPETRLIIHGSLRRLNSIFKKSATSPENTGANL
ncbi:MAG: murein biosynthesis integral membrane protein MurJ [bacterium]